MDDNIRLKILIIEDNEMFRSLAVQMLSGHTKHCAATAKDGIDRYKAYRPDITFLDIGLPDGNGLDVLTTIKSIDPRAFIIMLTQSRVASDVERAVSNGAAGYIIKPFSRSKIQQCLDMYEEYKNKAEEAPGVAFTMPVYMLTEEQPKLVSWRVLFVDDYHPNQEHAKKHFIKLGCEVDTAGSANQALELTRDNNYNLIFVDGKMPEKDGYALANEIRKGSANLNHKTPIVGLTENNEEAEDQRWLKTGMNSFMVKPVKFSKLKEVVESYKSNQGDAHGAYAGKKNP